VTSSSSARNENTPSPLYGNENNKGHDQWLR
jgi:hypothetical protein